MNYDLACYHEGMRAFNEKMSYLSCPFKSKRDIKHWQAGFNAAYHDQHDNSVSDVITFKQSDYADRSRFGIDHYPDLNSKLWWHRDSEW